jgi:hypothetical protein
MPDSLTTLLKAPVIEERNSPRKERKEKEFPKEEEENERKEKEEEDNSEDIEIEEEFSKHSPNLATTSTYFKKLNFNEKRLLNNPSNRSCKYSLQDYPPFYILFSCLKIHC